MMMKLYFNRVAPSAYLPGGPACCKMYSTQGPLGDQRLRLTVFREQRRLVGREGKGQAQLRVLPGMAGQSARQAAYYPPFLPQPRGICRQR